MTAPGFDEVNNDHLNIHTKVKLFRGLSDSSRLAIIEALRESPLTVNQIVGITGLSQSNVSNHLACLRNCGLVKNRSVGRFVQYELSTGAINQMLSLADRILNDAANAIYICPNNFT